MKQISFFNICILFFAMAFVSCKDKPQNIQVDPGYGEYVTAFTSGQISKQSPIKVHFANNVKFDFNPTEPLSQALLEINPKVEGKVYMRNAQVLEFYPDKPLQSGETYTATLQLDKCLEGVDEKYKQLTFMFKTLEQSFSVQEIGLQSYPNNVMHMQRYKGMVNTADAMPDKEVESLITAEYKGKTMPVSWTHSTNGVQHYFTVDSLLRDDKKDKLKISWDGDDLGIDESGKFRCEVPPLNQFSVLSAKVIQQPEQYVKVVFSDPIDSKQNLRGLVRLSDVDDLRFIVDGNELRIHTNGHLYEEHTVKISSGIRNVVGARMQDNYEMELVFRSHKPQVKFLGSGVISPSSQGLILPFEAVSLRAVQVRVIQVFESNVPQFLQNNRMDGTSELKSVARLVAQKRIPLYVKPGIDLFKWNTFSVDLAELIQVEPGAIYRVEIRFFRPDALYTCDNDETENLVSTDYVSQDEIFKQELEEWNSPGWYSSYYYPDNYRWKDKDNPCTDSYYKGSRFVHKNIFASDFGIIAKKGTDNHISFIISNLVSAQPEEGVKIEVLNYQNQLMAKCVTDKNGFADVPLEYAPYLVVAKKGDQRGYLKLEDGRALSVSNFDVGGEVVQKGVKAYIYGERGVWRPGDNMYLSIIINDEDNHLPKNHPVVMELINPNGQISMRKVQAKGTNGFFTFVAKTDADAPTGNWTVRFKVGGLVFNKTLKVETVKPNRLKIELDFNAPTLYSETSKQYINLSSAWLSGATASKLKAQVNMYCRPMVTTFKGFPNYVFDDPAKNFYGEERNIFEGKTDAEGKAKIPLKLDANNSAPGMLRANFVTKVFEAGGEFSINMQQRPFAPYTSFVGLKMPDSEDGWYLTDTDYEVKLATVNDKGEAISVNNIKVEVYKIDWRWWWDASDENIGSYVQSSSADKVLTYEVSTHNGKGDFDLNIPYHSWRDYGRYFIRVYDKNSGHSTGQICYFSKWYGQSPDELLGNASLLTVKTDKKQYEIGQKVKVSIPSSKGSKALVSIENGSKVLKTFWVDGASKETDFSFEVAPGMAPNAYIVVSLIQPHAQTENDRPIRLYGIAPFEVEDPSTKLKPEIKMAEVLEPETDFTVEVSEASGTPMTYTLAVVDEGLLDLTNFKTPNPWQHFYAREALGVTTWDMYNEVMGAFGARLESAFAVGGDENLANEDATKANRFKSVAMFFGPFSVKAGKSQKHTIAMPNYVGAVRTMVIAAKGNAYGHTEQSSQVRKPLMVLATLPRVLGPKETVKLPVTIFAMDNSVKDVKVEVKTDQLLTLKGQSVRQIHFDKTGDQVVNFDVEVSQRIGVSRVQIIATSGSSKATYDIEIDVRNPNPKARVLQDTVLQAGASWHTAIRLPGMLGTNKSVLELSTMPPMNFSSRMAYLIDYPHGCIEQTTSAAFPQLFLANLTKVSSEQQQQINTNIQAALNRYQKFQLGNGGFSYWPGGSTPADWGTSYAGHCMLLAEEKGYSLPLGMKQQWIHYQEEAAKDWERGSYKGGTYYSHPPLLQAYRLFTLALANASDIASMNRLREQSDIDDLSKWMLAAAYYISGQERTAQTLTNGLSLIVGETDADAYSYGSDIRNKALILNSLCWMQNMEKAFHLAREVSQVLSSDTWMSTQTCAFSLLAMANFAGQTKSTSDAIQATYTFDGGKQQKVNTQIPLVRVEVPTSTAEPRLQIKNTGDAMLYVRANSSGYPVEDQKLAGQQNLEMKVRYLNQEGEVLNPSGIKQGTDFMVEVRLKNPSSQNYSNMALTQIFPSGWEILNTRFGEVDIKVKGSTPTYQDIRDDRVYTYFDLDSRSSQTFVIRLNATYAGRFYMPAVACESMYNHSIYARSAGQWVKIEE